MRKRADFLFRILLLVLLPVALCYAGDPKINVVDSEIQVSESIENPISNLPFNKTWEHSEISSDQASFNFELKFKGFLNKNFFSFPGTFQGLFSFKQRALSSFLPVSLWILNRNLRL